MHRSLTGMQGRNEPSRQGTWLIRTGERPRKFRRLTLSWEQQHVVWWELVFDSSL